MLRGMEDHTPADAEGLVIDFSHVEAMTASFADEFLGNYYSTLATHEGGPKTVTVSGLNDDLRETIVIGFEHRDLVALEQRGARITLLAASEVLEETFQRAQALKRFTAVDVAEGMNLTPQNATNRLRRLVAARALIRRRGIGKRGGTEFTYLAPEAG